MKMVKFFTASLVSVLVLESSAYAVCGNGVLDSGEACEDGNTTNGDGCDDTCAIESGWDCTEAVFELDFTMSYSKKGREQISGAWIRTGELCTSLKILHRVCMFQRSLQQVWRPRLLLR